MEDEADLMALMDDADGSTDVKCSCTDKCVVGAINTDCEVCRTNISGEVNIIATTRIISMHVNKGKTIAQCLADRTDYAKNPDKTNGGELISAYGCDHRTADKEFLLAQREYSLLTGRDEADGVIAYQVRQSFKPGEVSPEEAHQIGYDFASRFLKGKHAFIVCTHTDRKHIHNHILWNSVTLDCSRKFRDFLGSGRAVARLSDLICTEHQLSVIQNPRRGNNRYSTWLGNNAKPSHRETLRIVIDIQAKLAAGMGEGYRRWATVENLKRMARTKLYMDEHGFSYEDMMVRKSALAAKEKELSERIAQAQKRIAEINVLKTHIVNYSKTRDIYVAYRKAGYSKKFLQEHEPDIIIHKAAKKAFDELGVKKLPTVKSLQVEFADLLSELG